MRILFVITEHAGGITSARREWYGNAQARIASLTDATVDSAGYWEVKRPSADAVILSGSNDPWVMHSHVVLERFYGVLERYPGPVLGICAGMQMLVRLRGGIVGPAGKPTRGFVTVNVLDDSDLFEGPRRPSTSSRVTKMR